LIGPLGSIGRGAGSGGLRLSLFCLYALIQFRFRNLHNAAHSVSETRKFGIVRWSFQLAILPLEKRLRET